MAVELIKRADLQVVDPASVKLRGYAAVFGNVFEHGQSFTIHRYKIVPGAFAQALMDDPGPRPILWSHGYDEVQIGETTELREDSLGLYFEGKPFATQAAIEVLGTIYGRQGARIGSSFSFPRAKIAKLRSGIEELQAFESIREISATTWGANPLAYAELVPLAAASDTAPVEPAAIQQADAEASAYAAAAWRATALLRSK